LGHPVRYPDPACTLYALASLRALAAKVERELFYLFARLRVEGDLPYRHPAVVAGVVGMVLIVVAGVMGMVLILVLGSGWVRVRCGRVIHVNSSDLLAGLRGILGGLPAGPFILPYDSSISLLNNQHRGLQKGVY
jgi:hypothetical protein